MKLGKQDAGIIFRESGAVEVAVPKLKEDEIVNDNILLATAVVMLMEEKSFKTLVNKQYKKLLKKLKEMEAESEETIKCGNKEIVDGTKKIDKKKTIK